MTHREPETQVLCISSSSQTAAPSQGPLFSDCDLPSLAFVAHASEDMDQTFLAVLFQKALLPRWPWRKVMMRGLYAAIISNVML